MTSSEVLCPIIGSLSPARRESPMGQGELSLPLCGAKRGSNCTNKLAPLPPLKNLRTSSSSTTSTRSSSWSALQSPTSSGGFTCHTRRPCSRTRENSSRQTSTSRTSSAGSSNSSSSGGSMPKLPVYGDGSMTPTSSSSLSAGYGADLMQLIRRMKPCDVDGTLQQVMMLQGSHPDDAPFRAMVRRIHDLIGRAPLHALSQAGDMVASMLRHAKFDPALDAVVKNLPSVLEARLEQLMHQSQNDGDLNRLDVLIEKHEQALKLTQRSLVGPKYELIATSYLKRWLQHTPMGQLHKQARSVAQVVQRDQAMFATLSERFHKATFERLNVEQLQSCALAARGLHVLGVEIVDSDLQNNYAGQFDALIKSWSVERLSQEVDLARPGGLATFCGISDIISQHARKSVSTRLKRWLIKLVSAVRTKNDLSNMQAEFADWQLFVHQAQNLGLVHFNHNAREAATNALSDCFAKLMEMPDSNEAIDVLGGIQWKVMILMGGTAENL